MRLIVIYLLQGGQGRVRCSKRASCLDQEQGDPQEPGLGDSTLGLPIASGMLPSGANDMCHLG